MHTPRRSHWSTDAGPFLITTLLGVVMTLTVIESIARSNWTDVGLPALVSVATGGLLVGTLFGRLRWLPAMLAHVLSALLGGAWVVARIGPLLGAGLNTWRDQSIVR